MLPSFGFFLFLFSLPLILFLTSLILRPGFFLFLPFCRPLVRLYLCNAPLLYGGLFCSRTCWFSLEFEELEICLKSDGRVSWCERWKEWAHKAEERGKIERKGYIVEWRTNHNHLTTARNWHLYLRRRLRKLLMNHSNG